MKTCPQCKYGMRTEWGKCPECGMKLGYQSSYGETPESDQWLRGYDDTPMVLDAYAKMQALEKDRDRWREKADHLGIACKVWEDAANPHPIMDCVFCGKMRGKDHICDYS